MEARAYHWRERAMAEFKAWPRTYMGTITMSPEQHYLIDSQIMQGERAADGRFIRHPKNLRELSPDELFHARASLFGQQVTLWLKRVRKRYGVNAVRYLLVAEAHDSGKTSDVMRGRPHYHILVHECELGHVISGDPVLALQTGRNGDFEKRLIKTSEGFMPYLFVTDDAFIRKNWGLGFTKFQLATSEKSVLYLCKYLSKSMLSRVRASVDYGLGVSLKPSTQEPMAIGPSSL